jgi:hypothetical protein
MLGILRVIAVKRKPGFLAVAYDAAMRLHEMMSETILLSYSSVLFFCPILLSYSSVQFPETKTAGPFGGGDRLCLLA